MEKKKNKQTRYLKLFIIIFTRGVKTLATLNSFPMKPFALRFVLRSRVLRVRVVLTARSARRATTAKLCVRFFIIFCFSHNIFFLTPKSSTRVYDTRV